MVFSHAGLEGGGGDWVRTASRVAPFDENAVGDAAKLAQDQDAIITLDAAPVIVVGDVQPLVQTAGPSTGGRRGNRKRIAGNFLGLKTAIHEAPNTQAVSGEA